MVETLKGLVMTYIQRKLNFNVEHLVDHAKFLNLDITIGEATFIYKLFHKRDSFLFSTVRMPHLTSNIPQYISV